MLDARSVAVVGASADPGKIGYLPVDYLVRFGYEGAIYPVNPRVEEVNGLRCYPSLGSLPAVPDLVGIMVAAPLVPAVLRDAGELGIAAAVIISAGFAEAGGEGADLQQEVLAVAEETGIHVCGPNSVGVIATANRMAVTFTAALRQGPLTAPGRIGIVSQSGAFGTVLYGLARHQGLSLHTYISTGNEAQLGIPDYIAAMVEHPDISTIGGYVEAIRDGPGFLEAGRAARQAGKPVVLVKVGASAAGASAATSHTGSLTGDDRTYQAAFDQVGVARAIDEQHLLDVLQAFDVMPNVPAGDRLAIASMSGGAGVLLCDAAHDHGLTVPPFPEDVVARLGQVLPSFAAVQNPVDFTGQFVTNTVGLRTVLSELAAVGDAVILFAGLGWTADGAWVEAVVEAAGTTPIVVVSPLATDDQRDRLRAAGVPLYDSPVQAVRVLKTLVEWKSWRPPEGAAPIGSAERVASLTEAEGKALLADHGLAVPRSELVASGAEASIAARRLGGTVVMKIGNASHKSDLGGVRLGVDHTDAARVFEELAVTVGGGVLIEEMITGGIELAVGASWQEPFGHVMMVGFGGVGIELLDDTAFGLAPLSVADAGTMVRSLAGYPLLDGYRGSPKRDTDALAEAISIISRIVAGAGPRLRELDINPIAVLPVGRGVVALDFFAEFSSAG